MQVREQPGCPCEDGIVFWTRSAKRLLDTGRVSGNSADARYPYTCAGLEEVGGPARSVQVFAAPAATGVLIGYAQVSISGRDDLGRQIGALATAGCTAIFADKNGQRSEFLHFLESARSGDTLVVGSLDRLADSLRSLILLVADLGCRGVGLKSLREGLDTTERDGQLIVRAFGALAEFIREVSAERTRYGLAAAKARGVVGGRPTVMTPDKIAAARALLNDNTVAAIARHVGVSRSTLYAHMELIRE
jgi:DNA invertase Pin-like site-specific DNA recombinase